MKPKTEQILKEGLEELELEELEKKAQKRAYYRANKDKIKAQKKAYYLKKKRKNENKREA